MVMLSREDIDELTAAFENQSHRAKRLGARAKRRGDAKITAGWKRAGAACEQVLKELDALRAQQDQVAAQEIDEDALRADLRQRLARFVEASLAVQDWETRRDAYLEAVRTGAPAEDPGPLPFTEDDMKAILQQPSPPAKGERAG